MKLILASQSTNRKRLFEQVGLEFEVLVSDYEEDMTLELPPEQLVQELALGKAQRVAKVHQDAVVVGADTVFVLNGKVGGKPASEEAALQVLKSLREARTHEYITGFAVVHEGSKRIETGFRRIELTLRSDLTDDDLQGYISSEREPVTTKAGGYDGANKGLGLISSMSGDYGAALGLPVGAVLEKLKAFGINPYQP